MFQDEHWLDTRKMYAAEWRWAGSTCGGLFQLFGDLQTYAPAKREVPISTRPAAAVTYFYLYSIQDLKRANYAWPATWNGNVLVRVSVEVWPSWTVIGWTPIACSWVRVRVWLELISNNKFQACPSVDHLHKSMYCWPLLYQILRCWWLCIWCPVKSRIQLTTNFSNMFDSTGGVSDIDLFLIV